MPTNDQIRDRILQTVDLHLLTARHRAIDSLQSFRYAAEDTLTQLQRWEQGKEFRVNSFNAVFTDKGVNADIHIQEFLSLVKVRDVVVRAFAGEPLDPHEPAAMRDANDRLHRVAGIGLSAAEALGVEPPPPKGAQSTRSVCIPKVGKGGKVQKPDADDDDDDPFATGEASESNGHDCPCCGQWVYGDGPGDEVCSECACLPKRGEEHEGRDDG